MTHPHEGRGRPALRRLGLGWGTALLSLMLALAPMDTFAAPAKAQASAKAKAKKVAKAKTHKVAQAKKRTVAAAPKKVVLARKPAPLPASPDKLPLEASVAYVIDQQTREVLFSRNDDEVRPIASLTKLMTGLIVNDAGLPLDQQLSITGDDVDTLKHSSSRLKVGTELTRRQALHLALMSSENRAAHALARTYPGGVPAFVSAMNIKARQLGMDQTQYVDPTGLSSRNRSSARDLAILAAAAYKRPLLRKYSTSPGYQLAVDGGSLRYVNSNGLVRAGQWNIGLQKTGYISEAGQCLLVQTRVDGRNLIMVFLDSATKVTRLRDAETVKRWIRAYGDDDKG
ncbi:MAG TPA: serine hydrolase [Ramlibacter sp.]|uniref:D-alanyl-D-alanine carboxypeptidase family protein n=1 Tax=Ramlibacter sp. TaxID=1917967 RepID=UPI002ED103F6